MARPEDEKIVKAMKEAKTAREMVLSWGTQAPGRDMQRSLDAFKLFVDRKPEMIETFAKNPLTQVIDRGILDRKTRCLVLLGIVMAMESKSGIIPQYNNAKAAGCTEEEVMEVAFLVTYQACKDMMGFLSPALAEAFKSAEKVESLK